MQPNRSDYEFGRVECLGKTRGCIAPDTPQPGHCEERCFIEPLPGCLTHEMGEEQLHLAEYVLPTQWQKDIRISQIPIVLRDFVFEDEMIAEGAMR